MVLLSVCLKMRYLLKNLSYCFLWWPLWCQFRAVSLSCVYLICASPLQVANYSISVHLNPMCWNYLNHCSRPEFYLLCPSPKAQLKGIFRVSWIHGLTHREAVLDSLSRDQVNRPLIYVVLSTSETTARQQYTAVNGSKYKPPPKSHK